VDYPFTASFGKAATRDDTIESSQKIFERLVGSEWQDTLNFEVLCQIAQLPDGSMDKVKVGDLIRMFRPSRNGEITKLEFVKSVDE
jgi:Ca2+-binding EF-hand superfamily protein